MYGAVATGNIWEDCLSEFGARFGVFFSLHRFGSINQTIKVKLPQAPGLKRSGSRSRSKVGLRFDYKSHCLGYTLSGKLY